MTFILENIAFIIFAVIFVSIGILISILIGQNEKIHALKSLLEKLRRSFDDLDEQAKIIVQTDLELNQAQDDLDRRLRSLDALQKTSRQISTTLEENEIFYRLERALDIDLPFDKNLVLIYNQEHQLQSRIELGFLKKDIPYMISNLNKDTDLLAALREGNTFSSQISPQQRKESIANLFNAEHFVLSPILTKTGIIGILFVGSVSGSFIITEGDEELISILANQIGQSLENARLFEEVFLTSQSLENKVQERTSQLETALTEVQNINELKSDFISAVSHELRTPLTSIKGYASLLMTGKLGEIPDSVKQRLEKINHHSDNLVHLINELLDIARIESGKVEMNIRRCSLKALVENVYDLLMPQLKEKNINWQVDCSESIPEIYLDSTQIERVFINLISNAIKFTPEGGTITVKMLLNTDNVTVEVTDTGIGIDADSINKLFNEFYRVENEINQNVQGTGLGLSLVKKIIEAHQGKIWVTSEIDQGTSFHFALPLTPKVVKQKNQSE